MSANSFPPTSRYYNLEVATLALPDGRTVAYLRRRFVPPAEAFALLQVHVVSAGQRLDHVAATYLGDPEQFWRIADANGAIAPEELTQTVGTRIRVTLPAGVPGPSEDPA